MVTVVFIELVFAEGGDSTGGDLSRMEGSVRNQGGRGVIHAVMKRSRRGVSGTTLLGLLQRQWGREGVSGQRTLPLLEEGVVAEK